MDHKGEAQGVGDQHSGKTKTMKPQWIDDERKGDKKTPKWAVGELGEKKGEHSVWMPRGKEGATELMAS